MATISSTANDDILLGTTGDDTFLANAGDDRFWGGRGIDTVNFTGARASATVRYNGDGTTTIVSRDGTDTLSGIELFQFSDGIYSFRFGPVSAPVIANFNPANGWSSQDKYPRHAADVNGDGYADIVGFGEAGTLVSFGSASGTFAASVTAAADFGQAQGWSSDNAFHRELIDVNKDGRADIVGFGIGGVLVSLAQANGSFATPVLGSGNFNAANGWSSQDAFTRTLGDVNGDGKPDVIGFGIAGTYVALGRGDGTFGAATFALADFGASQGWISDNKYHRTAADVNGDGRTDIVGFGIAGTLVALGQTDGSFAAPTLALANFGADQGWSSQDAFTRVIGDVNGDGRADVVGFGVAGTYVSYGRADGTLSTAGFDVADFGANQGWTSNDRFHRVLADLNRDGQADVVGFGFAGVLTAASTIDLNFEVITGTTGVDTLTGSNAAELIRGLDDNDTLNGRGGNDILEGGAGSDMLNGGLGDDVLYGNNIANSGLDVTYDYLVDDSGGNDQLFGQDGDDALNISRQQFNTPTDTVLLDGGSGNDTIVFFSQRMQDIVAIRGGIGNDTISVIGVAQSNIDAGAGDDRVTIGMAGGTQTITLGTGADILTLYGQVSPFSIGNPTRITDFTIGIDRLASDQYLASVLQNWDNASNPFGTGHLRLIQSGADTLLQLDRDGAVGTGYAFSTLLTFASTNAASLTARELGFAPDGSASPGQRLVGTAGADTLTGADGNDVLRGLGGNDVLSGRSGNDLLEGGLDRDQLDGGTGDDMLYGNNADNVGGDLSYDYLMDDSGGNDQLFGQDGNDELTVSRYDYRNPGSASTVLLDGGTGDDRISFFGNRFIDTVKILGGPGNDVITSGSALKSDIDAGTGDDLVTLEMFGGDRTVTLGAGSDTLSLFGTVFTFSIGDPTQITDFTPGTDLLDMDTYLASVLQDWDRARNPFGTGHLRLVQSGTDTLLQLDRDGAAGTGYAFSTLLTFASTNAASLTARELGFAPDGSATPGQTLIGTPDPETIRGTNGDDVMRGLDGNDALNGRGGNDVLEGGGGNDGLVGGLGDDVLYGNNAANIGGDAGIDGNDRLTDEDGGNDQLFGQDGNDFLSVSRQQVFGTIPASTVLLDGGSGDDSINFSSFRFIDTVTLRGGEGDDTISVGGVLRSVVDAGAGNDRVSIGMGGGDQTITLGAGADALTLDTLFPFSIGNPTRITDFATGTDTLRMEQYLGSTLLGWDRTSNPFGTGYLRLVQSGADTLLQLDRDGAAGTGYDFGTLLTFANTPAGSFSARDLGFTPDYRAEAAEQPWDGGTDTGADGSAAVAWQGGWEILQPGELVLG